MKTIILSLLLTLMCTCVTSAQDDRWVYFGYSSDGYDYYYDIKTIKIKKGNFDCWVKTIPQKTKYVGSKVIDYELTKWSINCRTRKITETDFNVYFKDGSHVNESVFDVYEVPPDSMAEIIYEIWCE